MGIPDITSIILAGGSSSRFGDNKALQAVGGRSLVQLVVDRLAILGSEIIVATADGQGIPCSSAVPIKTVADIHPGKGALVGIHSGLTASSSSSAIVVACDMPFLNVGLLRYMVEARGGCDVAVPRIGRMVEPLCAIYSRDCLVPIRRLLQQNELRILKLFSMVDVRYIEEDEIDRFDPEHLSFFNVNTPADLETATKLAAEKGSIVPDNS